MNINSTNADLLAQYYNLEYYNQTKNCGSWSMMKNNCGVYRTRYSTSSETPIKLEVLLNPDAESKEEINRLQQLFRRAPTIIPVVGIQKQQQIAQDKNNIVWGTETYRYFDMGYTYIGVYSLDHKALKLTNQPRTISDLVSVAQHISKLKRISVYLTDKTTDKEIMINKDTDTALIVAQLLQRGAR